MLIFQWSQSYDVLSAKCNTLTTSYFIFYLNIQVSRQWFSNMFQLPTKLSISPCSCRSNPTLLHKPLWAGGWPSWSTGWDPCHLAWISGRSWTPAWEQRGDVYSPDSLLDDLLSLSKPLAGGHFHALSSLGSDGPSSPGPTCSSVLLVRVICILRWPTNPAEDPSPGPGPF